MVPGEGGIFLHVLSHTVTLTRGSSVLVPWFVTMEKFLREWLFCDSVTLPQKFAPTSPTMAIEYVQTLFT